MSFFILIKQKDNVKECSNYHTVSLISHASKVMLKSLQQYMNWELPDVQAGFRTGRGTRDQIANINRVMEKAKEFQKSTYFCRIDCVQLWITTNYGKCLKRWTYQKTLHVSWEICMLVKKQPLEPDMEQQTGWKLGKVYKVLYCPSP